MKCPGCQHENRSSARSCEGCGMVLPRVCPRCGFGVFPTAKFCNECGAPLTATPPPAVSSKPLTLEERFSAFQQGLPPSFREQLLRPGEGENRIVTVLFTDMSSSVETTANLHPEDAAALVNSLLTAMVRVLLKYGGTVDRFLGDGLLAVFGGSQARESDPEHALRAALEIREAVRALGLDTTAGINTGEVYVGGVGSEQYQAVTVMGHVVNLAARLQGKAEPGQILVGEATYRQTRRSFAFLPLKLEVKGIPEPITAYVVERALPRPEKTRGIEGLRAEMIGREDELARLQAALDQVLQGQGQIVSVIGEAGVGKSRLVAELKAGCRVQGVGCRGSGGSPEPNTVEPTDTTGPTPYTLYPTPLWLEGRCLELGMRSRYSLFVDLFRNYFGWGEEHDDRERGRRIHACLRELVERGALSEAQSEEMGPLLGNLLSARFGNEWDEQLDYASPQQIRHQTLVTIREFLVALAGRHPVILVCEDLHWADRLSLDAIALLMETLSVASLLVLCLYRPEKGHACSRIGAIAAEKCADHYTRLELRELTVAQSRRLVASLLRSDALPSLATDSILGKARGNPFFVEELVRSLIDAGIVYREDGEWQAREGVSALTVPESIQSVILSRVDRLEPDLKHLLQYASVIGRAFPRWLLERTLQEAEAAGSAVPRKRANGRKEPADLSLASSARRSASAGPVARALLPGEVERALRELEDRWLIRMERPAPEEQYSFTHVLTQETVYGNILRRQRRVLHRRVGEAIETLHRTSLDAYHEQLAFHYDRSDAGDKAVEYLLKAGSKAARAYLNEEAIGCFEQALKRLEAVQADSTPSTGPPKGLSSQAPGQVNSLSHRERRLQALGGLGRVFLGIGKIAEAEARFREAIALGEQMQLSSREAARLFHWLGDVLSWQGRHNEQVRIGEAGLALLGDDVASPEAALMNHTAAVGYAGLGDRRKWRELNYRNASFLERLPYSEELRPAYVSIVVANEIDDRNVEEAMKWLRVLERKAGQHHDVRALGEAQFCTGRHLFKRGDLRAAIGAAQQGWELCMKSGDAKVAAWCLALLGKAFLALGELQQAEEQTRRALEIMVGDREDLAEAHMVLGTVFLCRRAWDRATDAFGKAAQLFHEHRSRREAEGLCALGQVQRAQGNPGEALRQFQAALAVGKGEPMALATALGCLEAVHEDAGQFRASCYRFQQEHPELRPASQASPGAVAQWFLEPAQPDSRFSTRESGWDRRESRKLKAEIDNPRSSWGWRDRREECSFAVQDGLEIYAANGQDLFTINWSAPRWLRAAPSEFAVETVCAPVSGEKPALGGILLWKDRQNFLRLDWGSRGHHEVAFFGRFQNRDLRVGLQNSDVLIGRGRLPVERVYLRLERRRRDVNAFCSADGRDWFTVGRAEVSLAEPLMVGPYAIGQIDRVLYPAAHREGTAIRFESFHLWR